MTDKGAGAGAPSRFLPLAVGAAAVLAVAGAGLFSVATITKRAASPGDSVRIDIAAAGCDPDVLTLPAGRHTFEVRNASARQAEWEILDGIIVLEEREHMVPGFRYSVSAHLKPGRYDVVCGLLSSPRGKLTVEATADSKAAASTAPELRAFIGPLAEYKVFLTTQGGALVAQTQKLADAVHRGDLAAARALYASSRAPYRKVEPIASRWSDLQHGIDAVAEYLANRENDESFTGFHRIEYGLFARNVPEGLPEAADRLLSDVTELKDRLRAIRLEPADLPGGAARLAGQLSDGKVAAGENAYSFTDLDDFDASLAGISKIATLIRPLLETADAALAGELDAALRGTQDILAMTRKGDAYPGYDQVDVARRSDLSGSFRRLAATFEKVTARLSPG